MVIRTWKFKIKNGNLAKDIFFKWFNDYKYAYNKAMFLSENNFAKESEFSKIALNPVWRVEERNYYQNEYYSKLDLRNLITPVEVNAHIPWFLETPKDIRADGVFEFVANKEAAQTNCRNGNIKYFEMKYMSKKSKKNRYCFGLPGSSIKALDTKYRKRIKIFSSYTNDFTFYLSKPLPRQVIDENGKLKSSHKIYWNGEHFYLLLSIDREVIQIPKRKKTVALDPGVRKMVTTWDLNNTSYFFGTGKSKQIKFLLKKRDFAQSIGNKRNYIKIENRIKNLMSELHHKTSTFLCKRYRNIISPKLNVKSLIEKVPSKEYRKSMLRMKLCEFNNLLKTKAEIYNSRVYSEEDGVHERYSSRMCSRCRHINPKSSDEWKICQNCGFQQDRDVNGAKNIYFMNVHLVE